MKPIRRIRTLIVDDSLLFRDTLARGVARDLDIQVVATASEAYMARDKIIEFEPDVMVLDVEMPRMNGIEFLRRLIPQYPLPVIIISALNVSVFDALSAGAVDFIAKPNLPGGKDLDSFIEDLIVKIKIASTARVKQPINVEASPRPANYFSPWSRYKIIAIGASTGGTEAVHQIIKSFSYDTPGTVVVQHMPADFTRMYACRLNETCLVEVKEAENGDHVIPGRVLIAPGDQQMRLKKGKSNFIVECYTGETVNGHRPSVDVLFESVAVCAGAWAVGVILTGMGSDGARGLLTMRKSGARTIGQDQASCVVYGMPKAAYDLGAVEHQYPLNCISKAICGLLEKE